MGKASADSLRFFKSELKSINRLLHICMNLYN
jgi:hypothetical protein